MAVVNAYKRCYQQMFDARSRFSSHMIELQYQWMNCVQPGVLAELHQAGEAKVKEPQKSGGRTAACSSHQQAL